MAPRSPRRQADPLKDANITRTYALEPLLAMLTNGDLTPTRNTVLVIDEISQIGPRPLLKLLEVQAWTGMTIKMLGDRIGLLRRALPSEALPDCMIGRGQSTRLLPAIRSWNALSSRTRMQARKPCNAFRLPPSTRTSADTSGRSPTRWSKMPPCLPRRRMSTKRPGISVGSEVKRPPRPIR